METFHEARIIPLDGRPHLPESISHWNGDSRGRWEGNSLIVDTTNFSSKSEFLGSADRLHLVERFTRVAPDAINYEATITDPTTRTTPWTAAIRLKQMETSIYEYACHEGNLSMIGILDGARAEEKAIEEARKTEVSRRSPGVGRVAECRPLFDRSTKWPVLAVSANGRFSTYTEGRPSSRLGTPK